MPRLSDEELKGAIDGWLLEFDRDPADREEADKFVAIIREVEREKVEPTDSIEIALKKAEELVERLNAPQPIQAYADKVLEVAVRFAERSPGMSPSWAVDRAETIIQYANEAAMKREEKS